MTTPARKAEASRVEAAFQVALAQMGAGATARAMLLWQDVPPVGAPSVRTSWLRRALGLIVSRRSRARELGIAYYRLNRALHTGATIPHPFRQDEQPATLDRLREEFDDALDSVGAPAVGEEPSGGATPDEPARPSETPSSPSDEEPAGDLYDADEFAEYEDDDDLLIEELPGAREESERQERQAEEDAERILKALGPDNMDRKVKEIPEDTPSNEADRLREEAKNQAGARQGATTGRIVQNGARGTVWNFAQRDKRVIGYVRISKTGTPCGWCAMLISRQVMYKTERGASRAYDDGDLYHDNCNCIAVPVFSREQFATDPKFDLNRQYAEEWPKVTKGLSGKNAIKAWRYYIRQQQKRSQVGRAATTNVQEA